MPNGLKVGHIIILSQYYDIRLVYCAMIDLSKAFDELNHDVMIDRLLKSSLPKISVKTIVICEKYICICMLENTFACFNN